MKKGFFGQENFITSNFPPNLDSALDWTLSAVPSINLDY